MDQDQTNVPQKLLHKDHPVPSTKEQERRQQMMLDPFPWYRKMRAENPVSYDEKNEVWELFRYVDVQRVVNDFTNFSSEQMGERQRQRGEAEAKQNGARQDDKDGADRLSRSVLNTDPPRHRQLRSLITQAFTPRSIAQLTPRITTIVNEHLDAVAQAGKMDVVEDLSYPLPVIVIAEMLGIPSADRADFKRWSDAVVGTSIEEGRQAFREMEAYFKRVIAQRRQQPQDDLISALIAAQIDGERLSEPELMSFCILLLIAGNETTTNLIGNAILCFDEHPQVMDELRADPSLLPGAIEEVLRYLSPVQLLARVASDDIVIGGKLIKAGDIVLPRVGSANRDEEQFPNADVFDIRRSPNRHVALGHGIHFCIGAPLARVETKIALQAMLDRFTDIKRVHDIPLKPLESGFVYGVKSLPITFRNA